MIKKSLILLCFSAVCATVFAARTVHAGDPMNDRDRWVKQLFLKGQLPFSFELGGRSSDAFLQKWQRRLSPATRQADGRITYTLTLTEPRATMQVRADIVTYAEYPAIEWTLHFTNLGKTNSAQLTHVNAADVLLAANPKGKGPLPKFTYYTTRGSSAKPIDFHLVRNEVAADTTYRYVPTGGRSSSVSAFPFYNIASGDTEGVFFSIGWTGTWFSEFALRPSGQLSLRAGMQNTDLYLLPGETIRTPLVSLLFWRGTERIDGNNAFRRFALAHHSPKVNGETLQGPLCAQVDIGCSLPCNCNDATTELSAAAVMERLELYGVHPEVYWMDAGWYQGCSPKEALQGWLWGNRVGTWVADSVRFPNGLRGLADRIHKNNSKLMVWFEPERAYTGSLWLRQHPEWFITYKDNPYRMLNLGIPEACDFVCKYIGDFLEQNAIDYYRQDFNIFNADAYWASVDPEGRSGITEIRHIEGLYRFWDYLLKRFPNTYIDNCASGGRRLDLETISRSIPLLRTDCYHLDYANPQCHTYGLSQFLPLHGTAFIHGHKYEARSNLCPSYTWCGSTANQDQTIREIQHTFQTFYKLRHYFVTDFYPLSGDDDMLGADKWIAWQYHDAKTNSGIVQAFRRDKATATEMTYRLHGVADDATYDIYDEDTNTTIQKTGRELRAGLTVKLDKPHSSALLVYSEAKKP